MLTERTYDSVVFNIYLNIITIYTFLNYILISIIEFIAIYAIKVPV